MQKILFDDKLNLTNLVYEGKKTQTRRQEITLHNTMWRWRDCDPMMENYNTEENGIHVYFSRRSRGVSDMIVRPKYKLGEEVAIGASYKSVLGTLNSLNGKNGAPTEAEYRQYVKDVYGIDSLESQKGFGNKLFIKPELMISTATITGIRFEQFEDISEEDAIKEGIHLFPNNLYGYDKLGTEGIAIYETASDAFKGLLNNELKIQDMTFWCVVYDFELHAHSLFDKIK